MRTTGLSVETVEGTLQRIAPGGVCDERVSVEESGVCPSMWKQVTQMPQMQYPPNLQQIGGRARWRLLSTVETCLLQFQQLA